MPTITICGIFKNAFKAQMWHFKNAFKSQMWHFSSCLQTFLRHFSNRLHNIFVAFLKIASKTIFWRLTNCLQNATKAHLKNATKFVQAFKNNEITITSSSIIFIQLYINTHSEIYSSKETNTHSEIVLSNIAQQ